MKQLDEAAEWYKKLAEADPQNKEAYYTLGVIAWAKCYPAWMASARQARHEAGRSGPIKDKKVQGGAEGEVQRRHRRRASQNLEKALADRQGIRRRDGLPEPAVSRARRPRRHDEAGYKKDIEMADNWVAEGPGDQEDQG